MGSRLIGPSLRSRRYRYLFSRYRTGLLSLIELISRPAASCGGTGHDDLQPGHVREVGLNALRVRGTCAQSGTERRPHRHRHRVTSAVMMPRQHVDDGVERARDEVGELVLDDRAQPDERGACCQTGESGFGDRSVDHTSRAELLQEALGHLEGAAELADVFADQKDVGIGLHLGHHRLADGLEIGDSVRVGFSRHRHPPRPCSRPASGRRAPY